MTTTEGSGSAGRRLGRSRRANVAGGRQRDVKVKVSAEEQAVLAEMAAQHGVSVPRLLVESAMSNGQETPSERRAAMAELFAIHRLLSIVSNNINQAAKVANSTGEVPAELTHALRALRNVAARVNGAIDGLSAP